MPKTPYFKKKHTALCTVAFYNLENLFDTIDDPRTLDDDFLPTSEKNWTLKRYQKKLYKLGTAISNIGFKETGKAPVLLGVAEIENRKVLEDLIVTKHMKYKRYGIVHYDSPDERGIDVGLLYQKEYFTVIHTETIAVHVANLNGERDYTRDILWVKGKLHTEELHIIVNHWPSRRDGAESTAYKRIAAAEKNRELIAAIKKTDPEAKIIIMGDFNDDPMSESVQHLIQKDMYNPMERLHTRHQGSLAYKGQWNMFDQVLFSANFHRFQKDTHSFAKAAIFDDAFLKVYKGRYKGAPFRTYAGLRYKGGYSDHFPVAIQLKWNT